ncbi:MAG: hypothetical protein KAH13_04330 [Tenericutes bacterium]|nr:hypothetical protein [Mycoplasmatota bacterium]
MKKCLILFLLTLVFSLTSCADTTEISSSTTSDLTTSLTTNPTVNSTPSIDSSATTTLTTINLNLTILGTRNIVLPAGESFDLLSGISIYSNSSEVNNDSIDISSNECTITGSNIVSSIEQVCNVTYYVEKSDNSDSKNITVTFTKPYQILSQVEEFNNLRIYQIFVSAYQDGITGGYDYGYGPSNHNGDLQGIINSLDYIQSLNMNAIWLTPIFESKYNLSYDNYEKRGRSTGYFPDDYYSIDPNFGTNELFRTLVTEAHNRGLYVLLDGVFGHHGSYSIPGITDGKSQWYGHEIEYPESLEYFIDVATYWIDEYEIDGWRLDQSYQLYQDNYNYFREIRNAVEALCDERKLAGEEWGILGYLVGEVWDSAENIQKYAFDYNALRSAFNFPVRFQLVRALAVGENGYNGTLFDLNYVMNSNYSNFAQPNLFLTNHDLLRFGDLIQISGNQDQYFERHKMALSFLAAYTGPITIYYGDEYGDEFGDMSTSIDELNQFSYIARDNVARSIGYIDGFDSNQQDLIDYVSEIMSLRDQYNSLWNGTRYNTYLSSTIYADLKISTDNQILYVLNISDSSQTLTVNAGLMNGTILRNLMTDETFSISDSSVVIDVAGLSGSFFIIE